MIRFGVLFLAASALVSTASAMEYFGTKEEATQLADAIIEVIDDKGIQAAVAALSDPEQPFATSRMGVNLFNGSVIVGDNREPEMVEADYAEIQDLDGHAVWHLVDAAADHGKDALLRWYHYDTQEDYVYHCYSRHAADNVYTVMICR